MRYDELDRGEVEILVKAIRRLRPRSTEAKEALGREGQYFANNAERMPYAVPPTGTVRWIWRGQSGLQDPVWAAAEAFRHALDNARRQLDYRTQVYQTKRPLGGIL